MQQATFLFIDNKKTQKTLYNMIFDNINSKLQVNKYFNIDINTHVEFVE